MKYNFIVFPTSMRKTEWVKKVLINDTIIAQAFMNQYIWKINAIYEKNIAVFFANKSNINWSNN